MKIISFPSKMEGVFEGGFNISAQSGTYPEMIELPKPKVTVMGKGSRPAKLLYLQDRAKKKTITQHVMKPLMEIALKKGEIERFESYKNTYNCLNHLYTANGRMFGTYCKNKFCEVCLGIRRMKVGGAYYPELCTWPAPFFTTLTALAVPAERLSERFDLMMEIFETLKDRYKKRVQRGTAIKFKGIRSLESNFNHIDHTYNPHFHFILPDLKTADTLMTDWRKYWGNYAICSPSGQDNRRIKDLNRQLRETIKYGTKFLQKPKIDKKTGQKIPPLICVAAIDNIFAALKGRRLFDRFGFNLPPDEYKYKAFYTEITEYKEWNFISDKHDWIEEETEQLISGFEPKPQLTYYLDNFINRDLE